MERWEEVYKGDIPNGKYQSLVKQGEEEGLIIKLESKEHIIDIDFGVVVASRILDEGILLVGIFDENEISKYRKHKFNNVIYKIEEGEFSNFIKKSCNELYDFWELKHYVVITINYVIEVISQWEPVIEISKID